MLYIAEWSWLIRWAGTKFLHQTMGGVSV